VLGFDMPVALEHVSV
jgi:hypothetical protein